MPRALKGDRTHSGITATGLSTAAGNAHRSSPRQRTVHQRREYAYVDREARKGKGASDHAPVVGISILPDLRKARTCEPARAHHQCGRPTHAGCGHKHLFSCNSCWADVKVGWRRSPIAGLTVISLVGVALVLHRSVPKIRWRTLAYIPEGPVIDWTSPTHDPADWLQPLLDHCATVGAFQVKMGPPIAAHRWDAATVKQALADADANRPRTLTSRRAFGEIPADWSSPWRPRGRRLAISGRDATGQLGAGFADVQPRFVYCVSLQDRTLDDASPASINYGVATCAKLRSQGWWFVWGHARDLADFHRVYVETAERDHFTPRGQVCFEHVDALNSATDDYHGMTLHIAEHEGHIAAATIMIRVGDRAWYSTALPQQPIGTSARPTPRSGT